MPAPRPAARRDDGGRRPDGPGVLRCVVGDRSVFFTEGLRSVLADHDVEVVGTAAEPDELPGLVESLGPDLLIAAFEPSDESVRVVPRVHPCPVLVLTWSRRFDDLLDALRGGARGFLHKDVPPPELARGLRDAVAGRTVMPAGAERVLLDQIDARVLPRQRHDDRIGLTSRELQILDLIVHGASNKEIARTLGIALQTVKNHTRSMMSKAQVASRSQLVAWATGRRLVAVTRPPHEDPRRPAPEPPR